MSPADIYSLTILVMAVEFQQGDRRFSHRFKAYGRHTVQRAVEQHTFRMRIGLSLVVWQTSDHSILTQSLKGTVVEDVTMVFGRISYPHEGAMSGNGTMIEV